MTENILADYISRPALALQLHKSERTLARWEVLRIGPAVTKIGQQPHYRVEAVRAWLRSREQQMPRARNLRAAASA
jgi:hypothetical protein